MLVDSFPGVGLYCAWSCLCYSEASGSQRPLICVDYTVVETLSYKFRGLPFPHDFNWTLVSCIDLKICVCFGVYFWTVVEPMTSQNGLCQRKLPESTFAISDKSASTHNSCCCYFSEFSWILPFSQIILKLFLRLCASLWQTMLETFPSYRGGDWHEKGGALARWCGRHVTGLWLEPGRLNRQRSAVRGWVISSVSQRVVLSIFFKIVLRIILGRIGVFIR